MGWMNERHPEHEGFTVALVKMPDVDARRPTWEYAQPLYLVHNDDYRELGYPHDADNRSVDAIQAGCACGWRSERRRIYLPTEAEWSPVIALLSERNEEWIYERWREHIATLDARAKAAESTRGRVA